MFKQQKGNWKVNLTLPAPQALAKVGGGRKVMEMLRETLDRQRAYPVPCELIPVREPCLAGWCNFCTSTEMFGWARRGQKDTRAGTGGMRRNCNQNHMFSSVQSLSRVQLFATPRTAACQASLSITNSQSSLTLTSIESVIHPAISSSVVPFSSCFQSLPAPESFPVSQLFA